MKKNRGHEPVVVIIHIFMEMSQENLLCSYLYLKQAKLSFFFFFSSTKSETRRENRQNGVGRVVSSGWGEGV
jgi:hypothetical protein